MTTKLKRAAKGFEAFTGRKARTVRAVPLADSNVAGWRMGPMVGVAYEATRDGKTDRYFHEFKKSARPDLIAAEDGRQLYIAGGKYTVTERGIEDVPELFVVNPSPRRAAARKGKSMAKAARNSKGRFVKRSRARSYKRNPQPRRRRAAAPRRRRATRQVAIFRSNPRPRRRVGRRTYRRNPIGGVKGIGKMLVPAMGVGAGAVGAEILMGYLPIPADFKTGVLRHITKGAIGIAAGFVLAKVLKQKVLGAYVAAGAVVIATHDAIKEFVANRLTMLPTTGFGQYVPALPSQFGGMGYVNPAATMRFGQYVAPLPSQFTTMNGMSQAYPAPGGETDFRA